MSNVTQTHEQKETLTVDVYIPGHEPRTTTSLFSKSRKILLESQDRCYICGDTAEQAGSPLEAHHHPIERSFAEMIDWSEGSLIRKDFPHFDWTNFDENDPYKFVDDMTVNGLILCKTHHTGKNTGIHDLPYPIWIAQRYGKSGYKFSDIEILHHNYENEK